MRKIKKLIANLAIREVKNDVLYDVRTRSLPIHCITKITNHVEHIFKLKFSWFICKDL